MLAIGQKVGPAIAVKFRLIQTQHEPRRTARCRDLIDSGAHTRLEEDGLILIPCAPAGERNVMKRYDRSASGLNRFQVPTREEPDGPAIR